MKKELQFWGVMNAKLYLTEMLNAYPYDIEERMVYSLLEPNPYPHPMLITFTRYFQTIFKLHIVTEDQQDDSSLQRLYKQMCSLAQYDPSLVFLHQYAFDVTYVLQTYELTHPYAHLPLANIAFLTNVQVHTIPVITMPLREEVLIIKRSSSFIYKSISMNPSSFIGICIRIEDKYGIIFISIECLAFAACIGALYTITLPASSYDFMLIYALRDATNQCSYYYDETNELYIGLVCGDERIHHFVYLKEMIFTLYNSICIEKQDLPMHASMLEMQTTKNFGIVFAGDTDSGKSEMMDAMIRLFHVQSIPYQALYDDCGIFHYLDNAIVSTGSEIAACKKITHSSIVNVFHQLHQSIFLKEASDICWQITPLTTHMATLAFHNVHCLCYLNPYSKKKGIQRLTKLEDIFDCFFNEQKDHAFLCGSLSCNHQKERVMKLAKDFFTVLFVQNIPVFEIYTHTKQNRNCIAFSKLATELYQQLYDQCDGDLHKLNQ